MAWNNQGEIIKYPASIKKSQISTEERGKNEQWRPFSFSLGLPIAKLLGTSQPIPETKRKNINNKTNFS